MSVLGKQWNIVIYISCIFVQCTKKAAVWRVISVNIDSTTRFGFLATCTIPLAHNTYRM